MPESRPPYPPQFRVEAVKLVQTSGKRLKQIADGVFPRFSAQMPPNTVS